MRGLRKLIRTRSAGGVVALCLAYALAIQAIMAGVGLGMSAAVASGSDSFVLCSSSFAPSAHGPVTDGDRQNPIPQPQCPFCFIAAQSAGHIAMLDGVPAFQPYSGLTAAAELAFRFGGGRSIPRYRRAVGDPRGLPHASV